MGNQRTITLPFHVTKCEKCGQEVWDSVYLLGPEFREQVSQAGHILAEVLDGKYYCPDCAENLDVPDGASSVTEKMSIRN